MLKQRGIEQQGQRGTSYLAFEVAGRLFALPTRDIAEIVPMAALSGEPAGSSILAGFLNLAGTAIPIIHLSRILELPDPVLDAHIRVIVVRHAGERYGLIVNKVLHIAAPANADVVALPGLAVAKTAVRIGAGVAPVIAVDCLVLEQEKRRIAELQAAQQRRLRELQEIAA